ncbi:hypothetical protein L3073_17755 [Ancylomarina sp. DW003]|nr:hypothetical protein [Ancylomarina sp. DW003]MDE5424064.1 hypothetical protein [Ancylomarina sp. DW003]
MKKQHICTILAIIFLLGCKNSVKENSEWKAIKDKQDFTSFFNFALSNTNSILNHRCIDSLEKYKPENDCITLNKTEYYYQSEDSLVQTDFYEYDDFTFCYKVKSRNIVYVNIDKNDNIKTKYLRIFYSNYYELIKNFIDTSSSSSDLPEIKVLNWSNSHYLYRNFATHIHCEMFPDTLSTKTSWAALIKETKTVLATIQTLRNSRSKHIFHKKFSELNHEEKKLIIGLIPMFIRIYFFESYLNRLPPPPPPPSVQKVLDILNDTSEYDLELQGLE